MGGWDRRSVGYGGRVAIVAMALAASGLDAIGRGPAAVRADQCRVRVERKLKNGQQFANPSGTHATVSTRDGRELDTDNPFFSAALGTNGRSCATCHAAEDGMSVSVSSIKERFEESCGLDPLFTGDGRNAPGHDVSTVDARRAASSVLLSKGLIRIKIRPPANAQYELVSVDDPHGNDASMEDGIVVFRRPLPATNLKFLNAVMWDTREGRAEPEFVNANLKNQADEGHHRPCRGRGALRRRAPGDRRLPERALHRAGETPPRGQDRQRRSHGRTSQPRRHAVRGRREPHPADPAAAGLSPRRPHEERIHAVQRVGEPRGRRRRGEDEDGRRHASRQSVARGEQIFNHRPITDRAPDGSPVVETCTACHNAFNAGNMSHSLATGRPFGGVASVRVSDAAFRTPDLPLYTFREKIPPFRTLVTTDPGQALKTGLTRDWNRFKSSNLRGLASRAPYFHNGMAATIADIVDHYDKVMNPVDASGNPISTPPFTAEEKADLIAFLESL